MSYSGGVFKSARMRWVRKVAYMGETRNSYILVQNLEGKRLLRRARKRIIK
jgi:hypothetical protein